MKVKLGAKLMTKFAGLIVKNYRKLLKENYKTNCLEAAHFENKIQYLEKIEIDIDSIKVIIKVL